MTTVNANPTTAATGGTTADGAVDGIREGAVDEFNSTVAEDTPSPGMQLLQALKDNSLIGEELFQQYANNPEIMRQFDELALSESGRLDIQSEGDKTLQALVNGMTVEKALAALGRGLDINNGPDAEQVAAINFLSGGDQIAFLEIAINWTLKHSADTVLRFNPVLNQFKFFNGHSGQELNTPWLNWMTDKLVGGGEDRAHDIYDRGYFSTVRHETNVERSGDSSGSKKAYVSRIKDEWVSVAPEFNRLRDSSPLSAEQLEQRGGVFGVDPAAGERHDVALPVEVKKFTIEDERKSAQSTQSRSTGDSGSGRKWGRTTTHDVHRVFDVAHNSDPAKFVAGADQALRETLEFVNKGLLDGNTVVLYLTEGETVNNPYIGNLNIIDLQSKVSVYNPGSGDSVVTTFQTEGATVNGGTGAMNVNAVATDDLTIEDHADRHDKENTVVYSGENNNTKHTTDEGVTNIVVNNTMNDWTLDAKGLANTVVMGTGVITGGTITMRDRQADAEQRPVNPAMLFPGDDNDSRQVRARVERASGDRDTRAGATFSAQLNSSIDNTSITTGHLANKINIVGDISNSTIDSGDGDDQVVLAGIIKDTHIKTGEDDDTVAIAGETSKATNVTIDTGDDEDRVSLEGFFNGISVSVGDDKDKVTLEGTFEGGDNHVDVGKGNDQVIFSEEYRGEINLSDTAAATRKFYSTRVNNYDVAALQGEGWIKEGDSLIRNDEAGNKIAQINLTKDAKHFEKVAVYDQKGKELETLQDIKVIVEKNSGMLGWLGTALTVAGSIFSAGAFAPVLTALGSGLNMFNGAINGQGAMAFAGAATGMMGSASMLNGLPIHEVQQISNTARLVGAGAQAAQGNWLGAATNGLKVANNFAGVVDPSVFNPLTDATGKIINGNSILDIATSVVGGVDGPLNLPEQLGQVFEIALAFEEGGFDNITDAIGKAAVDLARDSSPQPPNSDPPPAIGA